MKGFVNVTSGDLDSLKMAIAVNGPVSVAIDASHRSLAFYANGVYYEPQCGKANISVNNNNNNIYFNRSPRDYRNKEFLQT